MPLTTEDLLQACKGMKPSTRAWFESAKNYALYANQGGFYDDVLTFSRNSQMNDSFTRALLFVRQGRYREAESYLRKAIQNDPRGSTRLLFFGDLPDARPEYPA